MSLISPEQEKIVKLYDGKEPIFDHFEVSRQIKSSFGKVVPMKQGAYRVIETTEALNVIDVNSGKNQSRKPETLFHINVEAAKEIARQLRLRNISGMIIIDFINMKTEAQQKELVRVIKQELANDPVPARFVDITKLGLVELTRKKGYKSLREILI